MHGARIALDDRTGSGGPPLAESAALRGSTPGQIAFLAFAGVSLAALLWFQPVRAGAALVGLGCAGFLLLAIWRAALVLLSQRRPAPPPRPAAWPRYTIVAALHDEADIVGQLAARLARIDYPPDRLQGFLALETHDQATITAALVARRPDWLSVLVVPPGDPRTKPRALNFALAHADGDLLTVYDAEDEPDPQQLKEAAARFAADASGRLACLQAPLRIRRNTPSKASPFLDRQFAAEYASLFETTLPGLARLGLPFPLGGTSNHFRVDVLRRLGGWDAWNVTEDADLGFRLWRHGWRMGVITSPTWETPPGPLEDWLPQRCRWLKGYLQTWGVHTRRPWRLGVRGLLALVVTVGAGLAAAALHGPSIAWLAATVVVALVAGLPPAAPLLAISVMILGAASAWLSCALGARRAGLRYGPVDMIEAPAYWSLLSLAFVHAAWRLVTQPFAWDKTKHRRDGAGDAALDGTGSQSLSADHAAAPESVA